MTPPGEFHHWKTYPLGVTDDVSFCTHLVLSFLLTLKANSGIE